METMVDAAGPSEFEYDAQGRLSQHTPPLGLDEGHYVEYAYNSAGQKTGVKIWNGTTTSYAVSYDYYANGWLNAVKNGAATVASYSYDAVGNRTRVDYGNGTYTTFAYESGDPRYRLQTITHKLGTTTLAALGYTRDDVGNPLSFTGIEGAWAYTYDAMNRLASATPPSVPLPADAGGTYSYDWVGNMKAAASSNPWQYNAADQLTVWPGMHSYSYDDNGALTAVKTANGQTEQQTFSYHPTGLMDVATFNNQTQTLTNLWDADEHRVQFSIGEDHYTAVFDVTAGIPAVIKEVNPQGTVYCVREPGGELICRVVTVGETTHKWFYHFDELGSTRIITDDSTPAAVTDSYSYDAYGAVISHDRNTGTIDQPYQYVGQLGYYTHYQAPEFGWLQLGVRFYDAEMGRFERRDPVRGLPYSYAAARPMRAVDPSGLASWERVESPDWGAWWNPVYVHAFIHFDFIKCMGGSSWGFYRPGVARDDEYGASKKGEGWWRVTETRSDSVEFEIALCKCVTESKRHPPRFRASVTEGFYVCGSWVADMWECAKRELRRCSANPHIICHGLGAK